VTKRQSRRASTSARAIQKTHAKPRSKSAKTRSAKRAKTPRRPSLPALALEVKDLDALRLNVERHAKRLAAPRWNADPEDVQRSVAKLVLTLVEFLRKLMERQAVRRMEAGTLTDPEVESIGMALMRLEETIVAMARQFGLTPEELNLELGPLGPLM
jgi:hypothetical protein